MEVMPSCLLFLPTEKFIFMVRISGDMAKKSKGSGFQSAAGLIRYFEEEKTKGPKIDPKLVVYMAIIFAVIVELAKVFWPAQ
jgi:preprotein translocase subunit Sec61beta